MRRESYELQVSRPEVIVKEIDGAMWAIWACVLTLQKNIKVRLSKALLNGKVKC